MDIEIYNRVVGILKREKYEVFKILNKIFDIYAFKDNKRYLIKIFEDAIALKKENAEDMKRFCMFLKSIPLVISRKYKGKEIEFGGYKRYGIMIFSIQGFEYFIRNLCEIRKYSDKIFVSIDYNKLKEILKKVSISEISRTLNISKSTIIKYIFYRRSFPLDVLERIEKEYNVDLKKEYRPKVKRFDLKSPVSKKLNKIGANVFEMEKYKPKIYGNFEKVKFSILEDEKYIEKAKRFSKIFDLKVIGIDIYDKGILSVSKEEFFRMSKEEIECLLN